MRRMKLLLPLLVLAATVALIPAANAAPTVHFIGAGSSALFNGLATAAVNDVDPAGTPHHFTIKGGCTTQTCAQLEDPRGGIPKEAANLWVAYVCATYPCTGANATDIWAYLQVDSTVGNRAFFSRPAGCGGPPCDVSAVLSLIDPGTQGPNVANESQNLVSPSLFLFGVTPANSGANCPAGSTTCDDQFLPADVFTAISGVFGVPVTTAGTDIRPEDAYYATNRANAPNTGNAVNPDGLGYCGAAACNDGATIASSFSATGATPVAFGLPGMADPFTGTLVPTTITTIPVGESPILFLANRTNKAQLGAPNGAGYFYTNVVDNTAPLGVAANYPLGNLFGGNTSCDGADPAFGLGGAVPAGGDFPLTVLLREPLSGTMNTVEFSTFRIYGGAGHGVAGTSVNNSGPTIWPPTSQEMNVVLPGDNPLGTYPVSGVGNPCLGGGPHNGGRYRAIGTGEMVNTGILNVANSLGYAFFSFGNVSKIKKSADYGYLTLDGVDPLFATYNNGDVGQPGNGELPACTAPCPANGIWTVNPGKYFPNLVNGTYRSWSALRVVCDTATVDSGGNKHCTTAEDAKGVEALVANLQDDIHCGTNNSCGARVAGTPDLLPFSDDGSFGAAGGFGDAGYIRSHYAFRLNAARANDKYAQSHHYELFILTGVGGLPNNVANNWPNPAGDPANHTGPTPETGGDAGGCIVPATTASTICSVVKGTQAAGINTYTIGGVNCTGPAIQGNSYVTVVGLASGGDGGAGDPLNGVFQVTAAGGTGLAGSKFKTAAAVVGGPSSGNGTATFSNGCSQSGSCGLTTKRSMSERGRLPMAACLFRCLL